MGLLLDVVIKNAEDHPYVDLRRCVNRNQKRAECSRCIQICPKQVYDPKQAEPPKWDQCQNCGLCVTACATRCLAPSPVNIKRHLLLAQKKDLAVISCRRAVRQEGHVEDCIAQLPWELLAYLALGGGIALNLSPCRECPHEECRALVKETLNSLQSFLGGEEFEKRVQMHLKEDTLPKQEDVSRRSFFQNMTRSGKKAGAMVISDAAGDQADGLVYRRMLERRVREMPEGFSCRMKLPWFSEKCYGCGICALLCPNQAIEVGGEKDGRRRMYILPYRCTGCGVCEQVCREEGIEELALAGLKTIDKVVMAQVSGTSCARCGRAMKPGMGEYCAICQKKMK